MKENVVLGTHPQRLADGVHVRADVIAIDEGRPRGRREHSGEDGPDIENDTWLLYFLLSQGWEALPRKCNC